MRGRLFFFGGLFLFATSSDADATLRDAAIWDAPRRCKPQMVVPLKGTNQHDQRLPYRSLYRWLPGARAGFAGGWASSRIVRLRS